MGEAPIGIFAYATPPDRIMPERRTRALLAEGLLQDADLLLFSAADCDSQDGTVTARRWRNGRFETVRVPLPPLVVVISDPMDAGHREIGAWLRRQAEVLCDRAPDKLAQTRLFAGSALAHHAIPAEAVAPERFAAQLADCLARWSAAVVKPVDGMRGGNVHFVLPAGPGRWQLRTGTEAAEGPFADIAASLHARIAGRARYRRFMIQEYVASTFRDMLLGLRVDVAKLPDGSWRTIRPVVRVGVIPGSLASNYATGNAQISWERFFALSGLDPAIAPAAERIALEAAALVDAEPDAAIIEAGVDLVLDPAGNPRLIEVNARLETTTWEQDRAAWVIRYYLSRLGRRTTAPPPG